LKFLRIKNDDSLVNVTTVNLTLMTLNIVRTSKLQQLQVITNMKSFRHN